MSTPGTKGESQKMDASLFLPLTLQYPFWSMDHAHALLIFGAAIAHKPQNILEIGIGTGFITSILLNAIEYNTTGKLTCVDNWADFGGKEPDFIDKFRQRGVSIIISNEYDYCKSCPSDEFDFLVSDGDHGGIWYNDHFRMTKKNSICFFHDTNDSEAYYGLSALESYVRRKGWSCYHFKENSRPDEDCGRGCLMVINEKTPFDTI